MDNDQNKQAQLSTRRKGQTLAEFALTLPILLILLFGIIEFARIFQAWVALQNAARTAVRYATTGQYDTARYNIDTIVPCVVGAQVGTPFDYLPDPGNTAYKIRAFKDGPESLFATWYGVNDCDPGNDEDQERRKDILRLMSIMDEARRGAAGLALEDSPVIPTANGVQQVLYDVWPIQLPRSTQPRWFNVMICSTRGMFNELSTSYATGVASRNRFQTVLNEADKVSLGLPEDWGYEVPFCMLNEVQPASAGAPNNAGKRWLDPGGPGDRVTVVVTFNHQLITPLGLAPYVQIQARRAAVNESFRAARAVGSIQGSSPIGGSFPTATPVLTDTPGPVPTDTLPPTNTPVQPTETWTPVPPFDCDLLFVENVSFFANRFYIEFRNDNQKSTTLNGLILEWKTLTNYPDMTMSLMGLNTDVFWMGSDKSPATFVNTGNPAQNEGTWIDTSNRNVAGLGVSIYEGVFNNSPNPLTLELTQWDFGGSEFYFANPDGGPDCIEGLQLPVLVPTDTPDANQPTPTPTYTPDCASTQVSVRFDSWGTFGVVNLSVINQRSVVAPFTGFYINWIKRTAALTLDQVTVGGTDPDDPLSVKVWVGPDATGAVLPSTTGGTTSASEGTWLTNYTFPPNSITPLYLDFGGTTSTLNSSQVGVALSDFNGSWFRIGCGTQGGSGGGGGNQSGLIFLANAPTPPPTNTPKPTNTLGPTLTPSITKTKAPPTKTNTPAPPTKTKTPAPASNTPVPPTPTDPPVGGIGGSG